MRLSVILVLLGGILSAVLGYYSGFRLGIPKTSMQIVPDTRSLFPTVILHGIINGELQGEIKGNVRLFIDDTQVLGSGTFIVDAGPLKYNERKIIVPSWAAFVASVRGKKYYPVLSAAGSAIVPGNRLYFRSEEEAEEAGFKR